MKQDIQIITTNRKAYYQYFLIDKYKAGMILTGTEVKSVRLGRVSMSDAYCVFIHGELWVRHLHIATYTKGGVYNHAAKRDRKLLLQKKELRKLEKKIKEKGLTIVPVEMFINDREFIKLEISLAKGKKSFDKRNTIKEKDQKRSLERDLSSY